jgi:signal transduction histidine kinase
VNPAAAAPRASLRAKPWVLPFRYAVSLVTAALLLANLLFIGLLVLLSLILRQDSDFLTFSWAGGAQPWQLGRDILWQAALPFVGVSSLLFTGWIFVALILPLRRISRALQTASSAPLEPLLGQSSELGEVARRLRDAFTHRESLRREIAIRQELEARLRDSESRLQAAGRERERFIHDLHDGLIQSLFGIGLMLDEKRVVLEPSDPATARFLEGITRDINSLLSRLRLSLQRATPFLREISSLQKELQLLSRRFDGVGGLRCGIEFHNWKDEAVDPLQSMEIQAVCAEALMNIIRHSQARHARIQVRHDGKEIHLVIEDDGQGLPAHPSSGMGMASMKARALRAGGTLGVASSPGQGTSIHLAVPCARPSPPPAA